MSTIVIGDVHGCADELAALLEQVDVERAVFVGDLFTKGPDPAGVWALARDHASTLGNHDARLLACLDGKRRRDEHGHTVCATLDAADRSWRKWTRKLPLTLDVEGFTVVHAALPDKGRPDRETAIFERRRSGQRKAARWWQVYRGGPVIFGHDALRGLVRVERKGRPVVIGLDSGCVYGGHLSGYLPGEDRVVSVRARRSYRPV